MSPGSPAAFPRWLIGFIRCDHQSFLPAIRRLDRIVLDGMSAAGIPRGFYELAAHTSDIVYYGAGWDDGADERALAEFGALLRRASSACALEFRQAEFYTGLPMHAFGGPLVVSPLEEFHHWGSRACLGYLSRSDAQGAESGRYLFAMLLTDAIFRLLGFTREEKARCLEEWHRELLARGGDTLRDLAKDIPYGEIEELYAGKREFWRELFLRDGGFDPAPAELHPSIPPILREFRERLAGAASRLNSLRHDPALTRPYSHLVTHKLLHLNWVRLGLYNQYELTFLYLLRTILRDPA